MTKYGAAFVKCFNDCNKDFHLLNIPKNSRTRVLLECIKCGVSTEYTANAVKQHTVVCSSCKLHATRQNKLSKFISNGKKKYGQETFDYSNFVFTNVDTPSAIRCIKCDEVFNQSPYSHLSSKIGCPRCVAKSSSARLYKDLGMFKERIYNIFGDVYDYTSTIYTGAQSDLKVICKKCGSEVRGVPGNIANRVRPCTCYGMDTGGFNPNKPATLYYLRVEYMGMVGYKIGITNKTVAERYKSNKLGAIVILKLWEYSNGADARSEETKILRQFKEYKWKGPAILTDGNTELFQVDVLNLSKEHV